MRGIAGVVAVAIAALLVCCSADSHQEQAGAGAHSSSDRYDANGHKTRNLDPLGGGHLIREVRETRPLPGLLPYLIPRRYSAYGGKREPWASGSELGKYLDTNKRNFDEIDRSDLNPFIGKRNFDEIDRSDLNPFMGKRNFDEIDQSSLPFSFATKRFYHVYGNNYIDTPVEAWRSGFDKKRLRSDYPMDEIDLSHFPIGSKRSQDNNIADSQRYHSSGGIGGMDEIDATNFPIGSRRALSRR